MSRSSSLERDCEVVLGALVLLEQLLGDAVDVHVGRLRREHHRDEQLEVGLVEKRDLASGYSARSRSMIGRIRARLGPTRRRASDELRARAELTHTIRRIAGLGGRRGPRRRRRARGSVSRRTRSESAGRLPLDPAIAAESSASSPGKLRAEQGRDSARFRPFEELVDDLDLLGAGAEAAIA
jgi:hypothetical protein